MLLQFERWISPVAPLLLVTDGEGVLRALHLLPEEATLHRMLRMHYGHYELREAETAPSITDSLRAYFAGELEALSGIRTATGGTDFQREVWSALRNIPAGTTISYGQLASRLGRAGASRAVGAASGANPIAIVVPCHRVVGADGTLTGYAGGMANKRWLLNHEARFAPLLTGP